MKLEEEDLCLKYEDKARIVEEARLKSEQEDVGNICPQHSICIRVTQDVNPCGLNFISHSVTFMC